MQNSQLKTKKKRVWHLTSVLIIVNLILAFVLVAFLVDYIQITNNAIIHSETEQKKDAVKSMTTQLGNYLIGQEMVVGSYAEYITECEFDEVQVEEYLMHWEKYYESIVLADLADKTGTVLSGGKVYECDYKDIPSLSSSKIDFTSKTNGSDGIKITDAYKSKDGSKNLVSIYSPIKIDNRQFILLFEYDVERIISMGMSAEDMNPLSGILLDSRMKVIYGNMPGLEDSLGTDFFEYLTKGLPDEYVLTVKNNLSESGFATFEVSIEDRLTTTACGRVPYTDGWIYIYDINGIDGVDSYIARFAIIILVFFAFWLITNLIIFFRYNKKINNSIKLIEQQNEDLIRANVAKTAFVSNMSHEIRTPINAVLGMDEMILKEAEQPIIRGYAADIQKAGKTLLGIINDVLDFSKIESGKLEIIPVDYSPMDMLKDIYMMIKYRTEAKFLGLEVHIDTNLPKTLFGDDIRVKQVIVNLLTNAVKYTNEGTVTLTVESHPIDAERTELYVSVKDTGIGLKPEEIQNLFVEFQRLDEKKNRNIEGTGLGLPIVSRLLEMMGSKLEVDSAYGVGSNFYFTLEQKVSDATPVGYVDLDAHEEVIEKHEVKLYAPEARILVVDDTVINLKVVRGLLKGSGIKIDTATSGAECIQKVVEYHYDLIFLDHRMPKMDGIETLHRLKEIEGKNEDTPVIALTANVVSGAREMYAAEGFDDFLSKPVDSEHLEKMIRQYLPDELISNSRGADSNENAPYDATGVAIGKQADSLINTSVGLSNCSSMAIYKEILLTFTEDANGQCGQLLGYLYAKDLTNYQILVHGMKSSARNIGAMDVADEAYELEKKSGAGDLDYVTDHTNEFLKNYMDVSDAAKKLADS